MWPVMFFQVDKKVGLEKTTQLAQEYCNSHRGGDVQKITRYPRMNLNNNDYFYFKFIISEKTFNELKLENK